MNGNRDPVLAQCTLARFGIGLDTPENGMPLSAEFHRQLHTTDYYEYVNNNLETATSLEDAIDIVQRIRSELLLDDQFYRMTGIMPSWR